MTLAKNELYYNIFSALSLLLLKRWLKGQSEKMSGVNVGQNVTSPLPCSIHPFVGVETGLFALSPF